VRILYSSMVNGCHVCWPHDLTLELCKRPMAYLESNVDDGAALSLEAS